MELKNVIRQYADKLKVDKSDGVKIILMGNVLGNKSTDIVIEGLDYEQSICCMLKDGKLETKLGKRIKNNTNVEVFFVENKEQIAAIKKAKKDGAGFIIVYFVWAKETEKKIAKQIANAGADYIIGVKLDGGLGKYNIIETNNKRKVPYITSLGCICDENEGVSSEQVIIELEVEKKGNGTKKFFSEKIKPCITTRYNDTYKISFINEKLKTSDIGEKIHWEEGLFNVGSQMGNLAISKLDVAKEDNPFEKLGLILGGNEQDLYTIGKLPIAKKAKTKNAENDNAYFYNEECGVYQRQQNNREREARLVCAGQIVYDIALENEAKSFNQYEFAKNFKKVSKCFAETDLVVGNMTAMVSESYPTMTQVSNVSNWRAYYRNARTEFVQTLKAAGFSCLAMANPYNVCTGVDGIFETEAALKNNDIIVSGLGKEKNPVIMINGIKIAVLSYVMECFYKSEIISDEGAALLLNEFELTEVKKTIKKLKETGVEFVLLYLNCGNGKNNTGVKRRKEIAEKIAENGADYVICTVPVTVSSYHRYETEDKRIVPIATSIGSLIAGNNELGSALLKIMVRKTFDGNIEITDNFIPIKITKNTIVPLHEYFGEKLEKDANEDLISDLTEKLGNEIPCNRERKVMSGSYFRSHYTVREIYEFLNVEPPLIEKEILSEKFDMPVKCVVSRKGSLVKDCVAVITEDDPESAITIEDAVEKGAILVISEKNIQNYHV